MHLDVVREALHLQPFKPFNLRLVDGRTVHVPHPDFVAVAPRTLLVVSSIDGSISWLEPLLIQGIEWPARESGSAAQTNNGS